MIEGGIGGANTQTGLHFEGKVDLLEVIKKVPHYQVNDDGEIFYKDKKIALSFRKGKLYKFLISEGVDYKELISKRLLPDDAIFIPGTKTFYVIEMKFQKVAGSVDEKLQTCHFKKRQYEVLLKPLGVKVEYIYILSDWFRSPSYKDVLEYIKEVGCDYYFEDLPLERIGLMT